MLRFLVPALLLLIIAVPAAAGVTLPDDRVGEVTRAFLDAFNSNDDDAIRAFTLEYRTEEALARRPLDDRVAQYRQIHGMLGTVKPHSIVSHTEDELAMIVFCEGAGAWFQFTLTLEAGGGRKLDSLAIRPAADPEGAGLDLEGWTDLTDLLTRFRKATGVPAAAAAIVSGGKIVESAVVGVRAAGSDDAAAEDDPFHIGSVTKSITAVVVGKLIEEERLRPEATLGELLSDIDMLDVYRSVTVAQLLEHRGGIQPYTMLDEEAGLELENLPGDAVAQRGAFAALVLAEEPVVPPGSGHHYSNAGYSLLAHVAERTSESSWEEMVESIVFEPLGMNQSGFGWPATPEHPGAPRGHLVMGSADPVPQPLDDPYRLPAALDPAGDVHCSIDDLARYAAFHLAGLNGEDGPLKASTVQRLHTAVEDPDGEYAGGWVLGEAPDGSPRHWHNGSAGTFYAIVELDPVTGIAGVLAVNAGVLTVEPLGREILQAYRDRLGAD